MTGFAVHRQMSTLQDKTGGVVFELKGINVDDPARRIVTKCAVGFLTFSMWRLAINLTQAHQNQTDTYRSLHIFSSFLFLIAGC